LDDREVGILGEFMSLGPVAAAGIAGSQPSCIVRTSRGASRQLVGSMPVAQVAEQGLREAARRVVSLSEPGRCAPRPTSEDFIQVTPDRLLYQMAPFSALPRGGNILAGVVPMEAVPFRALVTNAAMGFGVATGDKGRVIILNQGSSYIVSGDGKLELLIDEALDVSVSFAMIAPEFKPKISIMYKAAAAIANGKTLKQMKGELATLIVSGEKDLQYVIRMVGTFESISWRRSLGEELSEVENFMGVMIGFWVPELQDFRFVVMNGHNKDKPNSGGFVDDFKIEYLTGIQGAPLDVTLQGWE
jgi:alpha-acetolactate decarboxylase